MFDRMRDRIAFALICVFFIAICSYIAVKFDGVQNKDRNLKDGETQAIAVSRL